MAFYTPMLMVFSVVLISSHCETDSSKKPDKSYPSGDIKNCLLDPVLRNTKRYEVLPGFGWDNLQNKYSGLVISYNYSLCKTTDDGRFLIPDNVATVPLKTSELETFAELFDHWSNYTSTTSSSINVDAGLHLKHFGISGKFSHESENVKSHQVRDRSITTRVQARYVRYSAKLQPDAPLSEAFRNRLASIAVNIQTNKTAMATYESQLLVRDFGTHVITSIDAGSALVQLDQIKSIVKTDRDYSKSTFLASASASFFSVVSVDTKYTHSTTKEIVDKYISNRTHSQINALGGPVFKPTNFSLNKWAEDIGDELIAMDKAGDPIYLLISPYSLPDLSPSILYDLTQSVKSAVEEYYKFNIYKGCTNAESPNFSFLANIDDGSCESPLTNYTFGGVFQTCTQSGSLNQNLCTGLVQKNPLTSDFSCPSGYEAVLIDEGKRSAQESRRSCHRSWFRTRCHNYFVTGQADYSAFWCVAKGAVEQQSGFQFGGIFTNSIPNLVTGSRECPPYFYPLNLGIDMKICVSDDFELGFQFSVPFAGFYSCKSGNPLMLEKEMTSHNLKSAGIAHSLGSYLKSASPNYWPKGCPNGFSSHLATVENSCEINYCVQAHAFSSHGLPPVRRPPFMDLPSNAYVDDHIEYDFTIYGNDKWVELQETTAQTDSNSDLNTNRDGQHGGRFRTGSVVAIVVGTLVICAIVVVVVISKRKRFKRSSLYRRVDTQSESSSFIRDQHNAYGSSETDSAHVQMNAD